MIVSVPDGGDHVAPNDGLRSRKGAVHVRGTLHLVQHIHIVGLSVNTTGMGPETISTGQLRGLNTGLFNNLCRSVMCMPIIPGAEDVHGVTIIMGQHVCLLELGSLSGLKDQPSVITVQINTGMRIGIINYCTGTLRVTGGLIFIPVAFDSTAPRQMAQIKTVKMKAVFPEVGRAGVTVAFCGGDIEMIGQRGVGFNVALSDVRLTKHDSWYHHHSGCRNPGYDSPGLIRALHRPHSYCVLGFILPLSHKLRLGCYTAGPHPSLVFVVRYDLVVLGAHSVSLCSGEV